MLLLHNRPSTFRAAKLFIEWSRIISSDVSPTRRRCLSFCTLFVFERPCHGDSSLSRLWIDSGIKEDASRDVAGPTWLHYVLYMYVHLSASEVWRRTTRNGEALVINTINEKTSSFERWQGSFAEGTKFQSPWRQIFLFNLLKRWSFEL